MTLQMVIFVAGLSVLFGILLQQDLSTYVPYVAIGYACFTWMTGMVQQGAMSVVGNGGAIKSTPGPLSVYTLRACADQSIQFAHDAVVVILVLVIFQVSLTPAIVLLPLALVVVAVNGVAVGLWLGPLCARYRDVTQIVNALIRVMFFFTPIFWIPSDLSSRQVAALAGWNPLAYLLEFLRGPLLGQWPTTAVVVGTVATTIANILLALVHFSHTRSRLAYWL